MKSRKVKLIPRRSSLNFCKLLRLWINNEKLPKKEKMSTRWRESKSSLIFWGPKG